MFEFRVLEFVLKYFRQTGIASSGVCLKIYILLQHAKYLFYLFGLLSISFLRACILYTSGHTSANACAIWLLYASIK